MASARGARSEGAAVDDLYSEVGVAAVAVDAGHGGGSYTHGDGGGAHSEDAVDSSHGADELALGGDELRCYIAECCCYSEKLPASGEGCGYFSYSF